MPIPNAMVATMTCVQKHTHRYAQEYKGREKGGEVKNGFSTNTYMASARTHSAFARKTKKPTASVPASLAHTIHVIVHTPVSC